MGPAEIDSILSRVILLEDLGKICKKNQKFLYLMIKEFFIAPRQQIVRKRPITRYIENLQSF